MKVVQTFRTAFAIPATFFSVAVIRCHKFPSLSPVDRDLLKSRTMTTTTTSTRAGERIVIRFCDTQVWAGNQTLFFLLSILRLFQRRVAVSFHRIHKFSFQMFGLENNNGYLDLHTEAWHHYGPKSNIHHSFWFTVVVLALLCAPDSRAVC